MTAKLIRVRDQVQIWAESYDNEPGSLLELQRELSTGNRPPDWAASLSGAAQPPWRTGRRGIAEAYDLYLRGRY